MSSSTIRCGNPDSMEEKPPLFLVPPQSIASPARVNPCVIVFGEGPKGETCRHCEHLFRSVRWSRTYLKCSFRYEGSYEGKEAFRTMFDRHSNMPRNFWNTHGGATDQKAAWPACGKFEGKAEA